MKKLRRFLTIGTYHPNSNMARLQALAWVGIIFGIGMGVSFIFIAVALK